MCVSAGQACSGGSPSQLSAMLVGVVGGGASASVRASVPFQHLGQFVHQQLQPHEGSSSRWRRPVKGKVAAILPDTVSSTRYVEFDQPDITKALQTAGAELVRLRRAERPRAATPPS